MSTWVSDTEALGLVAAYPVTVPSDFTKWLNASYLYLSNDPRYAYPIEPSEKMKLAQSLYACYLASPDSGRAKAIREGVASFSIGSFSESYSNKAQMNSDQYPVDVQSLLSEYRVGRGTSIELSRTYPSN
jgi:hypothetical protein